MQFIKFKIGGKKLKRKKREKKELKEIKKMKIFLKK